jgi:hypothetical protein
MSQHLLVIVFLLAVSGTGPLYTADFFSRKFFMQFSTSCAYTCNETLTVVILIPTILHTVGFPTTHLTDLHYDPTFTLGFS